ncbi:ComEC/Rec2 family competence protein [Dysosmobacter sp.]
MNELHILNVGRADCCVLLLDTQQGRKTVVVDGGELSCQGRAPLLEFLQGRGIKTVDLLILTHLHQDHFGGFHQLIGRVTVGTLVAPCGDLVFHERVYPLFAQREFYREYHRIFAYFQRTGTVLRTSASCAGGDFRFGESTLRCLYPKADSVLTSVACAQELCRKDLTEEELPPLLEAHKRACNADSSIWLLEYEGRAVALLPGDSTDACLRQALAGMDPVHPAVQKLSHHGIGQLYFSRTVQKALRPKFLVVSVDKAHYNETMQKTVEALAAAGGSQIHYTFRGEFTYRF